MAKVFSVTVLCFWLTAGLAFGENLSGKYTLSSQGTTLTLTLDQDAQGNIKGTLCPNGTYYSGSESGYSGGAGTAGAWGSASQRSGRGTWRVKGNVNEGVLTTIDSSGKSTEYRYRRCGGDCIYIGNTKFAVAGPANCP